MRFFIGSRIPNVVYSKYWPPQYTAVGDKLVLVSTSEHSCEELSERLQIRHQHPDALRESEKGLLGLCNHTRALGGLHLKDMHVAGSGTLRTFGGYIHYGATLTNAIGQRRNVAPYITTRVGVASTVSEGDFVVVALQPSGNASATTLYCWPAGCW